MHLQTTMMHSRFFMWLCILIATLSGELAHAATLIVKLIPTNADEKAINNTIIKPAGLTPSKTYHVTVGIIVNVPLKQAKALKKQIHAVLKKAHNAKKDPIRFNVGNATTWGTLNSPYYGANTVILTPSNALIFDTINAKLGAYVATLSNTGILLDAATSVTNYIPHITLKSPQKPDQASFAAQAVNKANQQIKTHPLTVHLYDYHIKICSKNCT